MLVVVGLTLLGVGQAQGAAGRSAPPNPKPLHRPAKQEVSLGGGRVDGSRWTILASAKQGRRGPGHVGCIAAIVYSPPSHPIEKKACGSLLGPVKKGGRPLLALAGSGEAGGSAGNGFDGSVLGVAVAPSVAKLAFALEPHRTLTVPTKLLTSRQAGKLRVRPFRYVAIAFPEPVCLQEVTGLDTAGTKVFGAAMDDCGTSPSERATGPQTGPPSVELIESQLPSGGTAELRGTVNPEGLSTAYHFEWGSSEAYENRVPSPDGDVGNGDSPKAVEAPIGGLKGHTTYLYRLVGQNVNGSAAASGSFTTPTWRPLVTAEPATEITGHTAMLSAKINAQSFGTHYRFEWGTSAKSYDHKYEPSTELTENSNVGVSFGVGELEGNTEYYFRVVAESGEGVGEGKGTFVTSPSRSARVHGKWTIKSSPNPGGLEAQGSKIEGVSCASTTSCSGVGEYVNGPGETKAFAERLGQTGWELEATPEVAETEALKGVSCDTPSDCMAVGYYMLGGSKVTLVEHWDGTAWKRFSPLPPNPGLGGELTGVSCSAPSECTAVGYYMATTTRTQTLALRWNGLSWSTESTPNGGGGNISELTGVSCNAFIVTDLFQQECVASGFATNLNGASEALAERWDGSHWEMLPLPKREGESKSTFLTGITCPPSTECVAVGYLENTAGKDLAIAYRWTGFFGRLWEALQPPDPVGAALTRLNGASCTDTRGLECMAVGEYETSGSEYEPFADQFFSEEGWSISETSESGGAVAGFLEGVSCVEIGECTSGGYVENSVDLDVTLIELFEKSN